MKSSAPVVLVTGAARRIGAAVTRQLHALGWNIVIHYRASGADARKLARGFNATRKDSAVTARANLHDLDAVTALAESAYAKWERLDALVNNASGYYATPLAELDEAAFDDLIGSNLKAAVFLIRACTARMDHGAIVNITDIHAQRPRKNFVVYGAAKAGLVAATEMLARDLAPKIRVNAVAPGHILWAQDSQLSAAQRKAEVKRVPLQRTGAPEDIASAVAFLLSPSAAYITGATLPVDGGLRLA